MKTTLLALVGCLPLELLAATTTPPTPAAPSATLTIHEIHYVARLADNEARLSVQLDA